MAPIFPLLATSAIISTLVERYAPHYSQGLILNGILLFFTELTFYQTWMVVIYPRFFSPLRHLPSPPGGNFFTGQTRRVLKDTSGMPQREWIENVPNDGLIRYSMWFQERLLPTNSKALAEVLVTKNYDFIKPPQLRNGLGRLLGIGILLAEGDEHKVQRKNLMPAFAYRHIKDLYPVFWSKSREMTECLAEASKSAVPPSEKSDKSVQDEEKEAADSPKHEAGALEVGNFSSRATLDIIGVSGMGQDFDSLHNQDNKLNRTYRTVFHQGRAARALQLAGLLLPFWLLSRLPVKRNADINGASRYIRQLCQDLVAQKRARMEKNERTEKDIVSVAIESGGFTDSELADQMMVSILICRMS